MIEIIHKPKELEMRCGYCLSLLRFKAEDIEDNPSTSEARWVHCPNCGSKLYVKTDTGEFCSYVHCR